MNIRPRRLRLNDNTRRMARETRLSTDALILPLFIREGLNGRAPIGSLDGHFHYGPQHAAQAVEEALQHGVHSFLLFGLPLEKDERGSSAYAEQGVVQQALRNLRQSFGAEITLITDVCLCEYTSHGHCGLLRGQTVNNDATLPLLAQAALSHAQAGADMVAPSDMMDGRVAAIRAALDKAGYDDTLIMSYAVKYASNFYGPFREAAGSAPAFGDRKSYQMDWHNKKEALKEALLDTQEGADILIVKPALSYLDVLAAVAAQSHLPVAAYSVSGEYAMLRAAGQAGLLNEYGVMCESSVSIFRAGAGILITYYAKELAEAIRKGDIG